VSTLYPATYPVYRRAGYEMAGTLTRYKVPLASLYGLGDEPLNVRRIGEEDFPLIEAMYKERARRTAGQVDRNAFMWRRALRPPGGGGYGYLIEGPRGGEPEGYLVFSHKDLGGLRYELHVRELVALTAGASRRLLRLLADHRSMAHHAIVPAAPAEAVFMLPAEEPLEITERMHWMMRVLDVPSALAARGYPVAAQGELHLDVRDDIMAANDGRFVLSVSGGKGEVAPGGKGTVKIDVRGLAPLFTGHLSAEELITVGLIEGPPSELAVATSLFAGPSPWMQEMF
jgi:predicted acetyltransferase